MKPWPAPALSAEQEVLYLSEPNPLGFFRNPDADEQSLLFRAAFSQLSTCTQEGVGESQQLPCPDFQAWESDVCKRRLGYLVFQQQSKTDVIGSG